ncbi:MAG: hypothetical protein HY903_23550 [Deltaproteobacteria bacterium]|nr:hypothetical protein [Deltaproteobacteria bacterium]
MLPLATLATLAVIAATGAEPLPTEPVRGYALVVTNNRSAKLHRPDLHYADDDGVKYAELFADAFGADHVTLLTELDAESAPLYPEWQPRIAAPTLANLDQAVAALAARLDAEMKQGHGVSLYLAFAAHGDVENGQGYLELADGPLGARALDLRVLARLPAARVHLILDSCNSYFVLNPRQSSAKRFEVRVDPSQSLLAKYPGLGAVISTSAEAVTYEWSELQSGIFSYILRSGLRGAADADHDGSVSYAEMAAFIATASRPVPNDLYRPKVFAQAPGKDDQVALLTLGGEGARHLAVPGTSSRRLTVRDRLGVRLADVHNAAGSPVDLYLPRHAAGLALYETVPGERPVTTVRELELGPDVLTLTDLPEQPPAFASRGEAPVFESLFADAFGPAAVTRYVAEREKKNEEYYGVSVRDVETLQLHLNTAASFSRDSRVVSGGLLVLLGGVVGGMAWAIRPTQKETAARNLWDTDRRTSWVLAGAGAAVVVAGTVAMLVPSESEALAADFAGAVDSSEEVRTRQFVQSRTKFAEIATEWRKTRALAGAALLVEAAAFGGLAGIMAYRERRFEGLPAMAGVAGLAYLGLGIYTLTAFRYPVERTWELYQSGHNGEEPATPALSVAPSLTPLHGGALAGVSIGF